MILIGVIKCRKSLEFQRMFMERSQVVFKRMTMYICHPLSTVKWLNFMVCGMVAVLFMGFERPE